MKSRNLLILALLAAFQLPALAQQAPVTPATPQAGMPARPMLSPEEREKVRSMTPEQRQIYMKEMREKRMAGMGMDKDNNPPGPAGGAGTNWENPPGAKGGPGASPDRKPFLTPEQRDQFKKMSPQERRAAMKEIREAHGGMGGGMQAHHPKLSPEERDKLRAMTPDQRRAYMQEKFGKGAGQGGCQPPACGPRQP